MTLERYLLHVLTFRIIRTLIFFLWAILLAKTLEKTTHRKRSIGITIFSILLLVASIHKLIGFKDYEYYKLMFQHLDAKYIFIRYIVSILWRLLAIGVAIGILLMKDFFRKLGLLMQATSIAILSWKHPVQVFVNISQYLEQIVAQNPRLTFLIHPQLPLIAAVGFAIIDFIFAFAFLYFFTRPTVKAQFSTQKQNNTK